MTELKEEVLNLIYRVDKIYAEREEGSEDFWFHLGQAKGALELAHAALFEEDE